MRKFLFFLIVLFSTNLMAQYQKVMVVPDTTNLKLVEDNVIVLLEQFSAEDLNGGGLFHRIDSTYSEGRDAFDYTKLDGLQWARIGYVEYGSLYISSLDTTSLTTDSTFYTINGFSARYTDGVTYTDSSATLISDAYYDFSGTFSYIATDSVKYKIALFKNGTIDPSIQQDFQVADNLTAIQNLPLSGVVYSDGNDVFAIKVEILENQTSKEFIINQANLKFVKLN